MAAPDRRGIVAWMLFDWANQPFQTLVVTFVFAPYFAATVVGDPVAGQALWGTATAIGGVMIAVLAPALGAIADRTGARKAWVLAFSLPYLARLPRPLDRRARHGRSGAGARGLRARLPRLGVRHRLHQRHAAGPRARASELGRISGSGWALGYLGGLVSLILVLLLLVPAPGGTLTLAGIPPILGIDVAAGEPARATGPLSALWYLVFAAPLFLFTPDAPATRARGAVAAGLADLVATFRVASRHRSFFAFLGASMLYRDALAALFTFGGIYAAGVLGWGMFQLGVFGIVAAAIGTVGAWAGGRADRAFGPLPVVVACCWALILVCAVLLFTTRDSVLGFAVPPGSRLPDNLFMALGGAIGAFGGALQAASRTLVVHQAEGRVAPAQAFGLFALSGRVTAFIGPAAIAAVTAASGSQRLGISPVILLFLAGLALLYWVKTGNEQPGIPTA